MPFDIVIGRPRSETEKLGTIGSVFIGRQYVHMGHYTSLSNNVYLDVARSHVVFVVGKRGCVTEDTVVFTDKGYKRIVDVDDTDKVSSYNIIKKKFRWENVQLISYNVKNQALYELFLENGQKITATAEHPLLTSKSTWKTCSQLRTEDSLLCINPKANELPASNAIAESKIAKITKKQGIKKVYDLAVPKNHSFIANGIISHNSGKSYSMGVIAEGMTTLPIEVRQNLSVIMLDTMGVYWPMKYPNHVDTRLLEEWQLEGKGLDIKLFTPKGFYAQYKQKGIPSDVSFAIKPSDLNPEDWCLTFQLSTDSPEGILLSHMTDQLRKEGDYDLDEMITAAEDDKRSDEHTRNVVVNHLMQVKTWGIFSKDGTPLKELAVPGQVSVLDMSPYATVPNGWLIKALVIGLIAKKLFTQRMVARKNEEYQQIDAAMHYFSKEKKETLDEPLVWLIVDEAHEMLPKDGKTAATDALVTIMREGRQPGISLVLASQQPGKIHSDVMTQ